MAVILIVELSVGIVPPTQFVASFQRFDEDPDFHWKVWRPFAGLKTRKIKKHCKADFILLSRH